MNDNAQKFLDNFKGSRIQIPNCVGRIVVLELDEKTDLFVISEVSNATETKLRKIVTFKVIDFIRECNRLHWEYEPTLTRITKNMVENYYRDL